MYREKELNTVTGITSPSNDNQRKNGAVVSKQVDVKKQSPSKPNKKKQKPKRKYYEITLLDIKKSSTKDLLFKLKQNKHNLKGIQEFITRFGFNSKNISIQDIQGMLCAIKHNIDKIMEEINNRLGGK